MTENEKQVLEQLLQNPKFRKHPSYDWLMLGPGDADFYMFDKPANPVPLMSNDYYKIHRKQWRQKVLKMEDSLMKRFGRLSAKKSDTKKVKKSFKNFETLKNKKPLATQKDSNKIGAFLRYEGAVPKVK